MKRTTRVIAAIMLMFATVLVTGCTEKDDNSGDWVDLGLPSGLLWTTRNVGAASPIDYGNYYAWGETSPKSVYNWSTYRYGSDDKDLIKYCTDSEFGHNGFIDGLITLQPGDDAATANYGGRTPTAAEWRELINNTTNQWVTMNGNVYGRCFTGSNGNSLFLPAAGCLEDSSILYRGSDGDYWSSSLDTGYPGSAWFGNFYSSYVCVCDGGGTTATATSDFLSALCVSLSPSSFPYSGDGQSFLRRVSSEEKNAERTQ